MSPPIPPLPDKIILQGVKIPQEYATSSIVVSLQPLLSIPTLGNHLSSGQLTMILLPPSCHIFMFLVVVLLVFSTGYYLYQDGYDYHYVYHVVVTGRKAAFIEEILENDIDGPFDNSTLAALCSSKKWIPGLIFKCGPAPGVVGDVRNTFLNCVRYAIEAGGLYPPRRPFLFWSISKQTNTCCALLPSDRLHSPRNPHPSQQHVRPEQVPILLLLRPLPLRTLSQHSLSTNTHLHVK